MLAMLRLISCVVMIFCFLVVSFSSLCPLLYAIPDFQRTSKGVIYALPPKMEKDDPNRGLLSVLAAWVPCFTAPITCARQKNCPSSFIRMAGNLQIEYACVDYRGSSSKVNGL
jgi:hypothetical protein